MQIYFHSRLCSYLPRVPILVEGTVCVCMYVCVHIYIYEVFAKTNNCIFLKPCFFIIFSCFYCVSHIYIYIYFSRNFVFYIVTFSWHSSTLPLSNA